MFLKVYKRMRDLVFSKWWLPNKEQIEYITCYYGYKLEFFDIIPEYIIHSVELLNLNLVENLIGFCDREKGFIALSNYDHRVFWHELGHMLTSKYFGERVLLSIPFLGWVVDETIATIIGNKLNHYWKRLIN